MGGSLWSCEDAEEWDCQEFRVWAFDAKEGAALPEVSSL